MKLWRGTGPSSASNTIDLEEALAVLASARGTAVVEVCPEGCTRQGGGCLSPLVVVVVGSACTLVFLADLGFVQRARQIGHEGNEGLFMSGTSHCCGLRHLVRSNNELNHTHTHARSHNPKALSRDQSQIFYRTHSGGAPRVQHNMALLWVVSLTRNHTLHANDPWASRSAID